MFDYAGWPGSSSYDDGKAIGIARSGKNFGDHATDEACASIETKYRAITSESLASKGKLTWWLVGPEVSAQERCRVAITVNGLEVAILNAEPAKPEGGYTLVQLESSPELEQKVSAALHLGKNEISAIPDCSTLDLQDLLLTSELEVHQDSWGEFDGVSINDGEEFTNSRDVKLNLSFSGMVAQVAVSNDGGFPKSQTQIFDVVNNTVDWTLKASTPLQMSRKVYVRYRVYDYTNDGALGAWQKTTYSDDIILDTTAPVITKASITNVSRGSYRLLDRVGLALRKLKRVQLSARDDKTGVSEYQISTSAKPTEAVSAGFGQATVVAVSKSRKTVFVRAKDGAGNWSAWKSVATD